MLLSEVCPIMFVSASFCKIRKLGRFNHPKEFHKKPETIPKAFPPGPIQPARGNGSQSKSGGSKDG